MIRLEPGEDHGIALDVIQIDGGTQSRATLNQQVVDDYAEAIKAGATFPPIVVFYDGKKHWLADGFHRFHAYQKAGKTKVAADVRQGTRRDAILHSVGANETHGLRRTRDDKRRAVLTLLNDAEWSKWTDREIANACRVDHKTVGKVRSEVSGEIPSERTYITKHGTTATMKTAGINASRAKPAVVRENRTSEKGGAQTKEITSETLAPQGVEGGAEPEKAVEEITPRIILDDLIALWRKAEQEDRDGFIAYLRILGFTITEIPAGSHGQCHELVAGPVDQQGKPLITADTVASASASNIPSDGDAFAAVKGKARLANAAGVEPSPSVTNDTRSATPLPLGRVSELLVGKDAPVESACVEISTANSPSAAPAETGEAPSPHPASPVAPRKRLRPHCLHPELCASGTRDHCHACKKAMAESGVEA